MIKKYTSFIAASAAASNIDTLSKRLQLGLVTKEYWETDECNNASSFSTLRWYQSAPPYGSNGSMRCTTSSSNYLTKSTTVPAGGKVITRYYSKDYGSPYACKIISGSSTTTIPHSGERSAEHTLNVPSGATQIQYINDSYNSYIYVDQIRWGPFYRTEFASSGYWLSPYIFSKDTNVSSVRLLWNASTPTGTAVNVYVRFSSNGTVWTDWSAASLGQTISTSNRNYIQAKIILSTSNPQSTPYVSSLYVVTQNTPALTAPGSPKKPIRWEQIDELRKAVNEFLPLYGRSPKVWTNKYSGSQNTVPREIDYSELEVAINEMTTYDDGSTYGITNIGGQSIKSSHIITLQKRLREVSLKPPVVPVMRINPTLQYTNLLPPASCSASNSSYTDITIDVSWAAVSNTVPVITYSWYASSSKDVSHYEVWINTGSGFWLYNIYNPPSSGYVEVSHNWSWGNGTIRIIAFDANGNYTYIDKSVTQNGTGKLSHYYLQYKQRRDSAWYAIGNVSATTYTHTANTNDYFLYRVRAVDVAGNVTAFVYSPTEVQYCNYSPCCTHSCCTNSCCTNSGSGGSCSNSKTCSWDSCSFGRCNQN